MDQRRKLLLRLKSYSLIASGTLIILAIVLLAINYTRYGILFLVTGALTFFFMEIGENKISYKISYWFIKYKVC